MIEIPISWKERFAQVVRLPFVRRLMVLGISLTVPRPRTGVAVVALDNSKRVFLLRHVFHPLFPWGLPGGWLKRDEAPEDGALRELLEETGLGAVIDTRLLVSQESNPDHTYIAFGVELMPGSLSLSPEIIEAGWFAYDDLPSPLSPFVKRAIDAAYASSNEIEHF
ncbi:MAG: NUDIX domain-containing protein [Candidatus Promineifilaceae bacterium]|nr:NUDIX domain-containing protein [Candidatus Promineifilaceae bacterium]